MTEQVGSPGKQELRLVRMALFVTAALWIPAAIQFQSALGAAGYLELSDPAESGGGFQRPAGRHQQAGPDD